MNYLKYIRLFLLITILTSCTGQTIEEVKKEDTTTTIEEKTQKLNLEAVMVERVVDGDTVKLSDGRKVRLVGVNTPESTTRTEEYGKEASNYTKTKLEGKRIWIQKDVSETDRYNRLLRIIWLSVPTNLMDESEIRTKMYNAELVLKGYAEPSTYPPDVKYSDYFIQFAREARKNKTGLWSYGENGTTKGDFDSKKISNPKESKIGSEPKSEPASSLPSGTKEVFQNCTELRRVYPNGVPSNHPAYQAKMDRDKDNYACEKS